MKIKNPKTNSTISWIILGAGAVLAIVGAMTAHEYKVNLCLLGGVFVIFVGIAYHLIWVRCPHCGQLLAGYRPLPKECPKCHKPFE